jgi:hypothetical protein
MMRGGFRPLEEAQRRPIWPTISQSFALWPSATTERQGVAGGSSSAYTLVSTSPILKASARGGNVQVQTATK